MEHIGCGEKTKNNRGNTLEVENGTHGLQCATVHCVVRRKEGEHGRRKEVQTERRREPEENRKWRN